MNLRKTAKLNPGSLVTTSHLHVHLIYNIYYVVALTVHEFGKCKLLKIMVPFFVLVPLYSCRMSIIPMNQMAIMMKRTLIKNL